MHITYLKTYKLHAQNLADIARQLDRNMGGDIMINIIDWLEAFGKDRDISHQSKIEFGEKLTAAGKRITARGRSGLRRWHRKIEREMEEERKQQQLEYEKETAIPRHAIATKGD